MFKHAGKLAVAAMAVFLTTVGVAGATTYSFTFDWSYTETGFNGPAPNITPILGSGSPRAFTTPALTLNGPVLPVTPDNFFTAAPNPSGDGGSGCPQCKNGFIDTGTIGVTFYNLKFGTTTIAGSFTDSATYQAKYGGAELGCAVGDGKSPTSGDTDCANWTSPVIQIALTGALAGDFLDIFLNDATDWNITPTIQFALTSHSQLTTPIPAALPLFASGLGGLGLLGWRRRKRKTVAALAAA